MDARVIVRRLVESTLLSNDHAGSVADDQPLLDSGLIDSMGIFELVSALENECGVRIEDDELIPENFNSIDTITGLVEQKLAA